MANVAISGVDRDELANALREGRDHGGNPIEPFVDSEGGWPLRCCLEDSQPGDEIAIIAWSPFSWKGAYAETGPVVVHTGGCAAPKQRDELPPALDARGMTLRPYGIDHRIAYGQVRHVSAGSRRGAEFLRSAVVERHFHGTLGDGGKPPGKGPSRQEARSPVATMVHVASLPYAGAMAVTCRPATPADREFARQAHHLAYRDVVERRFGSWDEEQQNGFFDGAWSRHGHDVVENDGAVCGYVMIETGTDRVDVNEIVIHPDHQNRGIGTAVLRQTIDRAGELGLPVYLQVIKGNRAADLYERLGFVEYGTTGSHRLMRLDPSPPIL